MMLESKQESWIAFVIKPYYSIFAKSVIDKGRNYTGNLLMGNKVYNECFIRAVTDLIYSLKSVILEKDSYGKYENLSRWREESAC